MEVANGIMHKGTAEISKSLIINMMPAPPQRAEIRILAMDSLSMPHFILRKIHLRKRPGSATLTAGNAVDARRRMEAGALYRNCAYPGHARPQPDD
jgi:hypothetical protein